MEFGNEMGMENTLMESGGGGGAGGTDEEFDGRI